jgi:hypothetical protein
MAILLKLRNKKFIYLEEKRLWRKCLGNERENRIL